MTALIPHDTFTDTTTQANYTILTPERQADFLASLQLYGNVRLACRAASISPQTAYRARRRLAGFARGWDAALLAARAHAEEVLADRAINGVEEAVFYHGEEVARRRRFDSRLLLAHLARLDRLEEREDVAATLPLLDDQIDALRRGEELPQTPPEIEPQDPVPPVPSCACGQAESGDEDEAEAGAEDELDEDEYWADYWADQLEDKTPLGRTLTAMEYARPPGAPLPHQLGDAEEVEYWQIVAFEAGQDEWWLVTGEDDLDSPDAAA